MVEKSGKAELLEKTKDLRALIESKNALMIKDIDEFADSFLYNMESNYNEYFINKAKREAKSNLEKSTKNQPFKSDKNKTPNNLIEKQNIKIKYNSLDKKTEKSHPVKSDTQKTYVNKIESNQDEVDLEFHPKPKNNERSVGLYTASLLKIVIYFTKIYLKRSYLAMLVIAIF